MFGDVFQSLFTVQMPHRDPCHHYPIETVLFREVEEKRSHVRRSRRHRRPAVLTAPPQVVVCPELQSTLVLRTVVGQRTVAHILHAAEPPHRHVPGRREQPAFLVTKAHRLQHAHFGIVGMIPLQEREQFGSVRLQRTDTQLQGVLEPMAPPVPEVAPAAVHHFRRLNQHRDPRRIL